MDTSTHRSGSTSWRRSSRSPPPCRESVSKIRLDEFAQLLARSVLQLRHIINNVELADEHDISDVFNTFVSQYLQAAWEKEKSLGTRTITTDEPSEPPEEGVGIPRPTPFSAANGFARGLVFLDSVVVVSSPLDFVFESRVAESAGESFRLLLLCGAADAPVADSFFVEGDEERVVDAEAEAAAAAAAAAAIRVEVRLGIP